MMVRELTALPAIDFTPPPYVWVVNTREELVGVMKGPFPQGIVPRRACAFYLRPKPMTGVPDAGEVVELRWRVWSDGVACWWVLEMPPGMLTQDLWRIREFR
jgi:hypothetical protein